MKIPSFLPSGRFHRAISAKIAEAVQPRWRLALSPWPPCPPPPAPPCPARRRRRLPAPPLSRPPAACLDQTSPPPSPLPPLSPCPPVRCGLPPMARAAFLTAAAWTTALVGGARPAAAVGRSAFVVRRAPPPPFLSSAAPAAAGGGAPRRRLASAPPPRMGLVDDVTARMKAAMKAKDADTLRVLRNMRAAFLTAEKETGAGALDDAAAVACLKRLVKQRNQSIEMYEKGGRTDLAEVRWRWGGGGGWGGGEGGGRARVGWGGRTRVGCGGGGAVLTGALHGVCWERWARLRGRRLSGTRVGVGPLLHAWLHAGGGQARRDEGRGSATRLADGTLLTLPALHGVSPPTSLPCPSLLPSFPLAPPNRSLRSLSWPSSRPTSPRRPTRRRRARGWRRPSRRWARPSRGTLAR